MHFEELLAMATELGKDKTKVMQFPENWCQGRTAFGGLSAALLYQAIRQHIDSSRRLLSLSTNFVGPLIADNDFSIDVDCLQPLEYQRSCCSLLQVTKQRQQYYLRILQ